MDRNGVCSGILFQFFTYVLKNNNTEKVFLYDLKGWDKKYQPIN
jgi:hypothetical protein